MREAGLVAARMRLCGDKMDRARNLTPSHVTGPISRSESGRALTVRFDRSPFAGTTRAAARPEGCATHLYRGRVG
jgi:hypothetical protein